MKLLPGCGGRPELARPEADENSRNGPVRPVGVADFDAKQALHAHWFGAVYIYTERAREGID